MDKLISPSRFSGIVQVPPSKSDAQRAILCAALAPGRSILYGAGKSADELAMQNAVKILGARIQSIDDQTLVVEGVSSFPNVATVSAGESGLAFRLLTSVCAAQDGVFTITAEGSLLGRPMDFLEEFLPKTGVTVTSSSGYPPLTVHGPMAATRIKVDGSQSSQFISGLLMALPLLADESELQVENLKSAPYLRMTLSTLDKFGVEIRNEGLQHFSVPGGQNYSPCDYTIEGDWSAASCWLVAAALESSIEVQGLSMSSLQADKKMLEVLMAAGCPIHFQENRIRVDGSKRKAFEFDATHCPDLFPALTVLAAFCTGTSAVKGASRLKHKESNRGMALQQEFGKLGVKIELNDDLMLIHGKGNVKGGMVDSHNDHRIAMALAITGMFADGPVQISGAEAVAKSYPDFWGDQYALMLM